jgi:hypothetical protein
MTKEEIIEMAIGIGLEYRKNNNEIYTPHCDGIHIDELRLFAELVAEHEREACAECGADSGHALYCVACAEKYVAPQRTWVWLTDKEVDECLQGLPTQTIDVYARRIQTKIKDKNT